MKNTVVIRPKRTITALDYDLAKEIPALHQGILFLRDLSYSIHRIRRLHIHLVETGIHDKVYFIAQ